MITDFFAPVSSSSSSSNKRNAASALSSSSESPSKARKSSHENEKNPRKRRSRSFKLTEGGIRKQRWGKNKQLSYKQIVVYAEFFNGIPTVSSKESTSALLYGSDLVYTTNVFGDILSKTRLADLIPQGDSEQKLRILHIFSGGFQWDQDCFVADSWDLLHDVGVSKKYHHPVSFLRWQKKHGKKYDIIIFTAPPNQGLLSQYLNMCSHEAKSAFLSQGKRLRVTQGDAGLARCIKEEMAGLLDHSGIAICTSFKSSGFGKKMGFLLKKIWIISHTHPSNHGFFSCHDTIVTVEKRGTPPERAAYIGDLGDASLTRFWGMYASGGETYSTLPIQKVMDRYIKSFFEERRKKIKERGEETHGPILVDPFARGTKKLFRYPSKVFTIPKNMRAITNDINKKMNTDFHLDAREFLSMIRRGEVGGTELFLKAERKIEELRGSLSGKVSIFLLDPPYSMHQSNQCYGGAGVDSVSQYTINSDLYAACREEARYLLSPGGLLITFGWSSLRTHYDEFELLEISLCAHGAAHDDTVMMIEKKKDSRE